jgi:hypothetical protein
MVEPPFVQVKRAPGSNDAGGVIFVMFGCQRGHAAKSMSRAYTLARRGERLDQS